MQPFGLPDLHPANSVDNNTPNLGSTMPCTEFGCNSLLGSYEVDSVGKQ